MKIFLFASFFVLNIICCFAAKSKVLIVFAHQEPQSFVFAMRNTVFQTLVMNGHEVKTSNLHQLKMILSLDRTDFTEPFDPEYFRPQNEQKAANAKNRTTFTKELRLEHDKVEWADIILFVFPYYVMYIPGIMKSWMERVFSFGFAYGEGRSLKGKKAMIMYATGADKNYLKDIEIQFWDTINAQFTFMGMTALQPFCAYKAAGVTYEQRKEYLRQAELIAVDIDKRPPFKPSE
jgi:NAD(P)H dehydrogenase (quinone)